MSCRGAPAAKAAPAAAMALATFTVAAPLLDEVAHLGARRLQREPDDIARTTAAHGTDQLVVSVQNREAITRNGFNDNGFDASELLEGVDPTHPEVIRSDVGHDCDVVAVIAQSLAQDASPSDLHDREVDAGVL